MKELTDSEKWKIFLDLRGEIYNQHCCISIRQGGLRGICQACNFQSLFEELDEIIKEQSEKK